jgi:hypothetical protein
MGLPEWIDEEAWKGFVEMRKATKKPLTERAIQLLVKRLEQLKADGYDPTDCIDQSTVNCWQGIFETKTKPVRTVARQEQEHRWGPPSPEVLAKLRGVLKRVA